MKYLIVALSFMLVTCTSNSEKINKDKKEGEKMEFPVNKSESEWKQELTDAEYQVLRKKGTERPFTGEYNEHFEPGVYVCQACGAELFKSDTKFDSHCGWPSFYDAIDKKNIKEVVDKSIDTTQTERTPSAMLSWLNTPAVELSHTGRLC